MKKSISSLILRKIPAIFLCLSLTVSQSAGYADIRESGIVNRESWVTEAVRRARQQWPGKFIEVEVTDLYEFRQALRARPDAILLDVRMPQVSGIDFLRRLRRDPQLCEVPVALVTGDYFLNEAALNEIHALGATVRHKPLALEAMRALAATLTGSGG